MKNPTPKVLIFGLLAFFLSTSSALQAQSSLHYFGWDTTLAYQATDIIQTSNGNLLIVGDANSSQPLLDNPFIKNYIVNTTSTADTIWTKTQDLAVFKAGITELPNNEYRVLGCKRSSFFTCMGVTLTTPYIWLGSETRSANWTFVNGFSASSECINEVKDIAKASNGDIFGLATSKIDTGSNPEFGIVKADTAGSFTRAGISSNDELQIEKAPMGYWLANNTSLTKYSSDFNLEWPSNYSYTSILSDFCKVENDKLVFAYPMIDNSMHLIKKDSLGVLLWDKQFAFRGTDVAYHSADLYIVTGVRDSSLVTMAVNSLGDSIWGMEHYIGNEVKAVKSIELQNGGIATLGTVGGFGESRQYVLVLDNTVSLAEYGNGSPLAIEVFPNPSNGVFQIKGAAVDRWEVYDIAGKAMLNGTRNTVDMSGQPKGIYLLRLYSGNRVGTTKLVLK